MQQPFTIEYYCAGIDLRRRYMTGSISAAFQPMRLKAGTGTHGVRTEGFPAALLCRGDMGDLRDMRKHISICITGAERNDIVPNLLVEP